MDKSNGGFGKVMMRKFIINQIKKKLKVDKFINLKFHVYGDGKVETVVNMEKHDDQQLEPEDIKELQKHLGQFEEFSGELEMTEIKFKVKKNGQWKEVRF